MTNTHAAKRNLRSRATRTLVGLTAAAVLAPLGATAFATSASAAPWTPPTSHTCGYPPVQFSLKQVPDVTAQERAGFRNVFDFTSEDERTMVSADLEARTITVTALNDDPQVISYTIAVNGESTEVQVDPGTLTVSATLPLHPGMQQVYVGGTNGAYGGINARAEGYYVGNAAMPSAVNGTCMTDRVEGPERVRRVLWKSETTPAAGAYWEVQVKDADDAVVDTFTTRAQYFDLVNYAGGDYSFSVDAFNADGTKYLSNVVSQPEHTYTGTVRIYEAAAAPSVELVATDDSDDVEVRIDALASSNAIPIGSYTVMVDRDGDKQYYGDGEAFTLPNTNPGEPLSMVLRDLPAGEAYSVLVTADHDPAQPGGDYGVSPATVVTTGVIVAGTPFEPAALTGLSFFGSNIYGEPVQAIGFDHVPDEAGTSYQVMVNGNADNTAGFEAKSPYVYESTLRAIAGGSPETVDLQVRRVVQGIAGQWSAPVTVELGKDTSAPAPGVISEFTATVTTAYGEPLLMTSWRSLQGASSYQLRFDGGTAGEFFITTPYGYYSGLTAHMGLSAGDHTVEVRAFGADGEPITPFTSAATVNVPVSSPVNQDPVLVADEATVLVGDEAIVDVLANDSDPDGNHLLLSEVWGSANGYAYVKDGKVSYTSNPDFAGTETLTYVVTDGTVFREGTLTITVQPDLGNHAPVANDDVVTFTPGDIAIFDVIGNDVDADGDQMWVHDLTQPTHGSADTVNGGIGYNPAPGFVGTDELTYTVTDGKATSSAKLTIVVKPAPTPVTPVNPTPVNPTPEAPKPTPEVPGNPVVNKDGSTSYTSPSGASVTLKGDILTAYKASGASKGDLGIPTTGELTAPDGKGKYTHFENGSIYWTPTTGAHAVKDEIHALWSAAGWEKGLGYPSSDEFAVKGGTVQRFTSGLVYTNASGTHEVHGAIESRYAAANWENSRLGGVVTSETKTPDGVGRFNHFEGGSIYWTPTTGAQVVHGEIKKTWSAAGWETSRVGYPTGEEFSVKDNGRVQRFQGGLAYWSPATGAHLVFGAFGGAFAAQGWENGSLGFPTSGEVKGADGKVRQTFQGGTLTWDGRSVTRS